MDSIVLKPGKDKWLSVLFGSLILVAAGAWLVLKVDTDSVAILVAAVFFGACALLAFLMLLEKSHLEITNEGFKLRHFGRAYQYQWSECSEFRVWKIGLIEAVVFQTTNPDKRGLAWLDQKLSQCNDGLPDTYGLLAIELARIMNEHRQTAIANQ